jgi:hypothetical protein
MKCPECVEAGKKSRVTPGLTAVTDMYCPPYYDEEGVRHHHDLNARTTNYSCSNGHRWVETTQAECGSCDWPNVKEKVANSQ